MMKKNGYVLLEMIISMGLLSLILLSASAMIFNFAKLNQKIINGRDKFENIRLGQYFLSEQILRADKIIITTDKNFSMKSVVTFIFNNNKYETLHSFSFRDKSIKFGGISESGTSFNNELALNISDVKINYDSMKNILHIKITTEDFPSLNFILYLKNKIVEQLLI